MVRKKVEPDRVFLLKRADGKLRNLLREMLKPSMEMTLDHGGAYSIGLFGAVVKTAGWLEAMIIHAYERAGGKGSQMKETLDQTRERFYKLGEDEFHGRISDGDEGDADEGGAEGGQYGS